MYRAMEQYPLVLSTIFSFLNTILSTLPALLAHRIFVVWFDDESIIEID